ncbi:MAG: hypothetical protein QMD11_08310 [Smithella sp.]|nr:hypothetical protein [Smithella sp.]
MSANYKSRLLISIILLITSISATLIIIEAISRIYYSEKVLNFTDYRGNLSKLFKTALPTEFHETLGWIPQPDYKGVNNIWGTEVTILKNGIRSNGNNINPKSSDIVVVVGDSFTFGDEVSDTETWPSRLEKLLNKPVVNAGVLAYGTDQIYLRLKFLLTQYKPKTIIFSFIHQDIKRSEYTISYGLNKPYFIIENRSLKLMNVPVKQVTKQPKTLVKILGYSYFLHTLMMQYDPLWWLLGGYEYHEDPTGYRGEEITCMLFQEMENILKENNIHNAYVLVQESHTESHDLLVTEVDYVLNCLNKEKFKVIDLRGELLKLKTQNRSRYDSLFLETHMSPLGNQFVAETIFHHMHKR